MNIDAKILNKILAIWIQSSGIYPWEARIIQHGKVRFILGEQESFNIHKSINMIYDIWYTTLTNSRLKSYDHLNRFRKRFWQNSTSIYKNSPQSGYQENICCCSCCLVTKSCSTLVTPMEYSPPFLCPWDFPGKYTGVSHHFLLQGIFPN